jgi:tRNA dimethylallyltransferase
MQVYKRMDIGTAKPTEAEMLGVPHHMIDVVQPWEDYSVALYVADASRCVADIVSRGKLPIVVGGAGLYIDSLLNGREFPARADTANRRRLCKEYDDIGGEAMLRRLGEFDRESAALLHPNDKKRIVRAFEVYWATGAAIPRRGAESQTGAFAAVKIALNYSERPKLYAAIDRRVDAMFAAGLEREARTLLDMGVPPDCTAMQAIGYKETVGALAGRYSMAEAMEMIKMNSRRYAKRQLTWLRRDAGVVWVEWGDAPDLKRGLNEAQRFVH